MLPTWVANKFHKSKAFETFELCIGHHITSSSTSNSMIGFTNVPATGIQKMRTHHKNTNSLFCNQVVPYSYLYILLTDSSTMICTTPSTNFILQYTFWFICLWFCRTSSTIYKYAQSVTNVSFRAFMKPNHHALTRTDAQSATIPTMLHSHLGQRKALATSIMRIKVVFSTKIHKLITHIFHLSLKWNS